MATGSILHTFNLTDVNGDSLIPTWVQKAFNRTYTRAHTLDLTVTASLVTINVQTVVGNSTQNGLLLINPTNFQIDYAFAGVSSLGLPAGSIAFHPYANLGGGISVQSTAGGTQLIAIVGVP